MSRAEVNSVAACYSALLTTSTRDLCVNLLRCGDAFSLSLRLYLRVSYRPICFVYKAKVEVIWFDTLVGLRPEFRVTSRFAYKLPNCWSQPTV